VDFGRDLAAKKWKFGRFCYFLDAFGRQQKVVFL
jgi:hypothetical protein